MPTTRGPYYTQVHVGKHLTQITPERELCILIVQMRKGRHREGQSLAQGASTKTPFVLRLPTMCRQNIKCTEGVSTGVKSGKPLAQLQILLQG